MSYTKCIKVQSYRTDINTSRPRFHLCDKPAIIPPTSTGNSSPWTKVVVSGDWKREDQSSRKWNYPLIGSYIIAHKPGQMEMGFFSLGLATIRYLRIRVLWWRESRILWNCTMTIEIALQMQVPDRQKDSMDRTSGVMCNTSRSDERKNAAENEIENECASSSCLCVDQHVLKKI